MAKTKETIFVVASEWCEETELLGVTVTFQSAKTLASVDAEKEDRVLGEWAESYVGDGFGELRAWRATATDDYDYLITECEVQDPR